jgi:hypothetical protein
MYYVIERNYRITDLTTEKNGRKLQLFILRMRIAVQNL